MGRGAGKAGVRKEGRPGRLSSVRPATRAAVTCSPAFAVPSAPRGLTSLFGMGRGGAPVLSPPWSFPFPGRAPQGRPSPPTRALRGALCPRRRTSGSETRSATPRRRPSGRSRARACAPCTFSVLRRRHPLPRRRGDSPFRSLRAISTARLSVSPRLHLRPIHVVVCDGPWMRPYLGAGFVLRCLQHLSCPDAATRRCGWRHNRFTGGPSGTVLSYWCRFPSSLDAHNR